MTGQKGLQPRCRASNRELHIARVSLRTQFNPQEMASILWAFTKVQRGDGRLFGVVARELMRQTNAGVVGVIGGGGGGTFGGHEQGMNGG